MSPVLSLQVSPASLGSCWEYITPASAFTHILVGPLHPFRGFTYLLTCMDWVTHWLEVLSNITTDSSTCSFLLECAPVRYSAWHFIWRDHSLCQHCKRCCLLHWVWASTSLLPAIHRVMALLRDSTILSRPVCKRASTRFQLDLDASPTKLVFHHSPWFYGSSLPVFLPMPPSLFSATYHSTLPPLSMPRMDKADIMFMDWSNLLIEALSVFCLTLTNSSVLTWWQVDLSQPGCLPFIDAIINHLGWVVCPPVFFQVGSDVGTRPCLFMSFELYYLSLQVLSIHFIHMTLTWSSHCQFHWSHYKLLCSK